MAVTDGRPQSTSAALYPQGGAVVYLGRYNGVMNDQTGGGHRKYSCFNAKERKEEQQ